MYREHYVLSILIAILLFLFFVYINFIPDEDIISNLITILSILFGFTSVSIAMIFTSEHIKSLYREIDPKIDTQRKIHTVIKYYKNNLFIIIFSICLMILYLILAHSELKSFCFINDFVLKYIFYISISLSIVSIYMSVLVLKIVANSIISEAKG